MNNVNPLRKLKFPRLKLAITYLGIIMFMSILFSTIIYNISFGEIRSQRSVEFPRGNIFYDEFERTRDRRLEQAKENLRNRLVVFNLITLVAGGFLSYVLAMKSLRPIEEVLDAQERFTSDASHEIKTPLTVMKSEIEVTLRDKNLNIKDAKNTLESCLEEVVKLENLTSGLLQLARYENSEIIKQEIDPKEIIKNAVKQLKTKAEAKKLTIKTSDEFKKSYKFMAEPETLTQSLIILIDNAIKYSPPKSTINISFRSGLSSFGFSIKDQGPGIDPKDLPHIFERFYRSDQSRTNSSQDGYGLGLSIAKQIIESQGGNIKIISKKDQGTTFQINLPRN